ncbi:MAG: beta-glucosidase [Bacilli bacterium]|nr:beta-glucosidase [Bacilli bacterium]
MNILDKIKLLSGKDVWHTHDINEKLPSILMSDGPSGLRKQIDNSDNLGVNNSVPSTLFPAPATLACSFNPKMAYLMGEAIGLEARNQEVNLVLAPGINIKRNDLCGRNFEYFSEDPLLAGIMGKKYIEGLQSNNVGASLKHFAANNQEDYRFNIDSVIDERALREIYLKNFQIALEAKPKTVMCSYNKLNGELVAQNKWLLTDVLRDEFKFSGLVVSDWGAVSNRVKSLKAGLDLEMPANYGYSYKLVKKTLDKNEITKELIEKSASRVIKLVNELKDNKKLNLNYDYSKEAARTIARESIVLLKNENVLPFRETDKVLIVGEFAKRPRNQGGGSSFVNSYESLSLLSEISKYTQNYKYLQGYSLDGNGDDNLLLKEVLLEAKDYDKVLIMSGLPDDYETEGVDRTNIDLPSSHLKLIDQVSKINNNVVVNLYTGAAIAMPFINNVQGVINSHLLGFDSATALLDIVYGKVSPSGRLAYTNPFRIEDNISSKNFANANNAVYYLESIYVGYRYYVTRQKEVLFPFGYGLSYSSFEYSNIFIDRDVITKDNKITLKVNVKNTGNIEASEVVMVFIENNKSSVHKPLRELRKFDKVNLQPKEEKVVEFTLEYDDFSYYDVNLKRFHVDRGKYKIQVCKNANEVILEEVVKRLENDFDFIEHEVSAYNNVDIVSDEDFRKLFNYELPLRNVKRNGPYSLDNNLEDVKETFIGKLLYKLIFKEVEKLYKSNDKNWVVNVVNNTIGKTPLRTIATMSNKVISLRQMQALVDLMNRKIIRGLLKVWW